MLETLIGIAAEGLFSLGGPVAVSKWADRLHRGRVKSVLAQIEKMESQTVHSRNSLALALVQAGVSAADAGEVWGFLEAPEGQTLIRFIATATIARGTDPATTGALQSQAVALIRMFRRSGGDPAPAIAEPLCREISKAIEETLRLIRFADKDLAAAITDQAVAQARDPRSMSARAMSARSRAMDDISATLPSEVYDQVMIYGGCVEEATRSLTIPTMRSDDIVAPHESLYVRRGILDAATDEALGEGLLAVLTTARRVVALGDPGGGKSTEVRNLLLELSRSVSDGNIDAVPFLIKLRHYGRRISDPVGQSTNIFDFMCETIHSDYSTDLDTSVIRYLFHTGRAVVCFDGLDEVLDLEDRSEVATRIQAMAANFPHVNCIVTSRKVGYESAPMGESFTRVSLPRLTKSELHEYCDKFFTVMPPSEVEVSPADFLHQTKSVDEIRRNPLMLGVLCSLYLAGRRVPRNRLELYKDCSEMLFSAWDSRRRLYVDVDDEINTEAAVNELALEVFRTGEEDFSEPWVRSFLIEYYISATRKSRRLAERFADAALDVWQGRRWMIVDAGERGGEDYFRFSHRTFLEYYAARQMVFECETSTKVFSALEPYLETRSATVFCSLAAEISAAQYRGAANELITAGVAAAREARLQQNPSKAYNLLAFFIEIMPTLRWASAENKQLITESMTSQLADISIHVPIPVNRLETWWSGVDVSDWDLWDGYSVAETGSPTAEESFSGDEDDEGPSFMTFSLACGILLALDELSAEDRQDQRRAAVGELRRLMAGEGDAGNAHRLLYSLFFATFLESWRRTSLGRELQGDLRTLISSSRSFSSGLDREEPDYWVLLRALAADGYVPPSWKGRLQLRDLVTDVTGSGGAGPSVALVHIALIDLLGLVMEDNWYRLHPKVDLTLVSLAARIARSSDRSSFQRIAYEASELLWVVQGVTRPIARLGHTERQQLIALLAVVSSSFGENSFAWRVEQANGVGKQDLRGLIEFLRYPVVASTWEGVQKVFPGLAMSKASALELLEWLDIS